MAQRPWKSGQAVISTGHDPWYKKGTQGVVVGFTPADEFFPNRGVWIQWEGGGLQLYDVDIALVARRVWQCRGS